MQMICVLSYQNHVGLCKPHFPSIARGIRVRKTVLREPECPFPQRCGGSVTSSKARSIRLRDVQATPLVNDPLGIQAVSEAISLLYVRIPCILCKLLNVFWQIEGVLGGAGS